jgi:C-terminal processing protease CtpA/Prc
MYFIFRPHSGEIRQIYIEKSSEALGITIKENQKMKKGVFVSSVSENSLANQVGLQVSFISTYI